MKITGETCLVLDCSTLWVGAGVFAPDSGIEQEVVHRGERESFQLLFPLIQKLLRESGVKRPDRVCVVRGPGSFTGTRIAVSSARDLAQLWGVPLSGLDTLAAYGYSLLEQGTVSGEEPFSLWVDGKQKRVYARTLPGRVDVDRWESSPALDEEPETLLKEERTGAIYADSPGTITPLLSPENAGRILEMPAPTMRAIYNYAVASGALERGGRAEDLTVSYLRNNPFSPASSEKSSR